MNKYKIAFVVLFFILAGNQMNAQTTAQKWVIAGGGKSVTGGAVAADWTVGEMVINYVTPTGLMVNEGFHPITAGVTGVKNVMNNPLSIVAFPNPTNDRVTISITQRIATPLTMQVMDIKGNLVKADITLPGQINISTVIDLSDLAAGMYFIAINGNNENAQVMRIIRK